MDESSLAAEPAGDWYTDNQGRKLPVAFPTSWSNEIIKLETVPNERS
jgi:hypothetical protein